LVFHVKEGNDKPLEAFLLLRAIKDYCESAIDEIKENCMKELDLTDGKVELFGEKLSFTQSGQYDYKDCHIWRKTKEKLSQIENAMKLAFAKKELIKIPGISEMIPPAIYSPSKKSIKIN